MSVIAVAGGTGLIGRMVVGAARRDGHEVRVISRSQGVDLMSGAGLDDALRGVRVVIDAANVTTMSRSKAVEFFGTTTGRLLEAGQRAGVAHHVALSIVGIDRVDYGYYEGKRRQEELVTAAPVPWTILRATQFHEFAGQILDRVPGPVVVVPRMLTQPVAAVEVAGELVRLAGAEPAGFATEIAGPQQLDLVDMARDVIRARHQRRIVLPLRMPGAVGRAMAGGDQLPKGEVTLGRIRFADWLASQELSRSGS
ncbi:NAD(P)H-binding protein [Actinoplanes sp. NPDC024001]|uniref:SDR family oxidoreductase n=1 Tax=Actinoplanes sp. NPDC024001 TaxID=3154598 RepID=UPI0033C97E68